MTLHHRSPMLPATRNTAIQAAATKRHPIYQEFGKRALDLVLIAVLAVPTLLIVSILALLVARDGASPFYFQDRVGRNGKTFRIWKLRSMVPDADKALENHLANNPAAKEEWNLTQKLQNDPRVTRVGRIIRKTSLDELPQLWNVLLGEMSLVGPRPMMPCQRSMYPGTAYYALRPGITGSWQVSARNESSFAQRAQFDTSYNRNLSFSTDLNILLRTVRVVIKGTGC